MGLLLQSLSMIILLMWFFCLPALRAQSTNGSSLSPARALDALLQAYAYKAFHRPKTGIPYEGAVPSNLTGINITALRLRSGSLFRYGVAKYNEFHIPKGVSEQPYVKRLVLVYQNLGNRSATYYQLSGYTYLTPVLGLLAYNASNLLATDLPELNITATRDPISIRFSDVKSAPDGAVAKCVQFDLYGQHSFSNVSSNNQCSTIQHGHFSIVKFKHRKKVQQMERAADVGEALHMTTVGNTKAPAATVTRTQPVLETEYAP